MTEKWDREAFAQMLEASPLRALDFLFHARRLGEWDAVEATRLLLHHPETGEIAILLGRDAVQQDPDLLAQPLMQLVVQAGTEILEEKRARRAGRRAAASPRLLELVRQVSSGGRLSQAERDEVVRLLQNSAD
jgi:hypothetical protein